MSTYSSSALNCLPHPVKLGGTQVDALQREKGSCCRTAAKGSFISRSYINFLQVHVTRV